MFILQYRTWRVLSFVYLWKKKARNCSRSNGKVQLCCTVLPQGFKNSPTLFSKVLAKELEDWHGKHPSVALWQYVNNILIRTTSEQECKRATIDLLNFMGLAGYRVSQKKAQIVQTTVEYLGFEISQGERQLELEHDCLQVIEQVYSSWPDLKHTPLEKPDWELFTDGSSFVGNGEREAGYAVLMLNENYRLNRYLLTHRHRKLKSLH